MISAFLIHGIQQKIIITSYIEATDNSIANGSIIILPNGNYTASSLAATLALSLQARFSEIGFSCNYNTNVGTIKITNSSNSQFRVLTDETVVSLQGVNWYGDGGDHHLHSLNINNFRSINEALRNSVQSPSETSYESGFIDLLSVHKLYIYIFILRILGIIILLGYRVEVQL